MFHSTGGLGVWDGGKLPGLMVMTVLWMPAARMLHPANILAQETSSPDRESTVRLAAADLLFRQGIQQYQVS